MTQAIKRPGPCGSVGKWYYIRDAQGNVMAIYHYYGVGAQYQPTKIHGQLKVDRATHWSLSRDFARKPPPHRHAVLTDGKKIDRPIPGAAYIALMEAIRKRLEDAVERHAGHGQEGLARSMSRY